MPSIASTGPGDEIRHIDWRAFGKTDRYYVKEYEEETNLKAMIVVDSSGSMGYAGRTISKLEHARRMAASLAYLMIGQRDAVGLATFDTRLRSMIPPRSAPCHFSVICQGLEATRPAATSGSAGCAHDRRTDQAARAGDHSLGRLRRLDDLITALSHLRHRHHEVLVLPHPGARRGGISVPKPDAASQS